MPSNSPPTATFDSFSTSENNVLSTGNVLLNTNPNGADSDPDVGDTLTVTEVNGSAANVGVQVSLPLGALLTVNSDGTFTYNPNGAFDYLAPGQSGLDFFMYTVSDGNGGNDSASVFITVSGVNDAPTATDDSFSTSEDMVLMAGNLLINANPNGADSDPDFGMLTVAEVNGGANVGAQIALASGALLTVDAWGAFAYDPNSAFNGLAAGQTATDSFQYTVSDGQGGTDSATVTITVTGANDAPTALDDNFATNEDTALTSGNVLTNSNGTDTDPDSGQTANLVIAEVNGSATNVGTQFTLASGALLTVNAGGSFAYNPNGAFNSLPVGQTGTDSFQYTVSDGQGGTDTATVTITVSGVNDAPTASDDGYSTNEEMVLAAGNVLTNSNSNGADSDPDLGSTLTVVEVNGSAANVGTQLTLASGALLTVDAGGTFTYDPNGVFNSLAVGQTGTDSFQYTVSDGQGGTDTATVTVTVTGANDAPTAADDNFATNEDAALVSGNVLTSSNGADTDPDNGETASLTITAVNGSAANVGAQLTLLSGALLTLNSNGTFSFALNGAFNHLPDGQTGTDSFQYTVSDGQGGTDTATVTITVSGVNDAPTATDDSFSTNEDVVMAAGNVLTNANPNGADSDPDLGSTLTVVEVNGSAASVGAQLTLTSGALLTVNADGTVSYDPNGVFNTLKLGQTATESFQYTVSDGQGGTDTATVTITVNGANDAPQLVDPGDRIFLAGEVVNIQIVATDPDGDALTFEAENLPPGLTINSITGIISGTVESTDPSEGNDEYPNAIIRVRGANNATDEANPFFQVAKMTGFTITVTNPAGYTGTLPAGENLTRFTFTVTATGTPGANATLSWELLEKDAGNNDELVLPRNFELVIAQNRSGSVSAEFYLWCKRNGDVRSVDDSSGEDEPGDIWVRLYSGARGQGNELANSNPITPKPKGTANTPAGSTSGANNITSTTAILNRPQGFNGELDSDAVKPTAFTFTVTIVGTANTTVENLRWSVIEPDNFPNPDDELVQEREFSVTIGADGKGTFTGTFFLWAEYDRDIVGSDENSTEIEPNPIYVLIEKSNGSDLAESNTITVKGV